MKVPDNIKIILRCKICKKKIDWKWVDDQIDGLFLADNIIWSELLGIPVILDGKVRCASCIMNDRD